MSAKYTFNCKMKQKCYLHIAGGDHLMTATVAGQDWLRTAPIAGGDWSMTATIAGGKELLV